MHHHPEFFDLKNVRGGGPEILNPMLAKEIERRWHALGHLNVRVWTETVRQHVPVKQLSDGTVLPERTSEMVVIRSNLVNGLPPQHSRASALAA